MVEQVIIIIKLVAWGGSGGVVFISPDSQLETNFSWRIGRETNNIAEALALWQGLMIAMSWGINDLIVLGDSRIIIQALT